jgi:hypothetical protein
VLASVRGSLSDQGTYLYPVEPLIRMWALLSCVLHILVSIILQEAHQSKPKKHGLKQKYKFLQVEREELLRKRGHEEKVVEVQYIIYKKILQKTKQTDGVAKESNQNGSIPKDNNSPDH